MQTPSTARSDPVRGGRVWPCLGLAAVVAVALTLVYSARALAAGSPYVAVDIGTIGGTASTATAVNDAGLVVGSSTGSFFTDRPITWTEASGMSAISDASGGTRPGNASAVSPNGRIAGSILTLTFPAHRHAFTWSAATGYVDLGTLGGPDSDAYGVNDAGEVVGTSTIASGQQRAFVWTPESGMVDLGTLGGTSSTASGINADGTVVGSSDTGSGQQHAFTWTLAGGMIDLGTLVGGVNAWSMANAISDTGQIVGSSIGTGSLWHAFSWTLGGGMVDLGALAPSSYSAATAVSTSGQVVGYSGTSAFSWTPADGMADIGGLGGGSSIPSGVNASGRIVGRSTTLSGESHATVWRPSDAPPLAPSRPVLDIARLSGYTQALAVPVLTTARTLYVTGLAEPSTEFMLAVDVPGGRMTAFSRTDASGRWDYPVPSPVDGVYVFSATAISSTGTASIPGPVLTVAVDGTGPTLNVSGAPSGAYDLATLPARPSFLPADAHGVKTQSDSWQVPGTASGIGSYVYTATATDSLGNVSNEARTYTVGYGSTFSGPDPKVAATRKAGVTVPIRFTLMRGGTPILGAAAALWVGRGASVANPATPPSDVTLFRYDATARAYVFALRTDRAFVNPDGSSVARFVPGAYTLTIALDDGSLHSFPLVLAPAAPVRPVIKTPAATPARPMAGALFKVTFAVTERATKRPLASGTMRLDPRIGGRLIHHRESFARGRAVVSLTVPHGTRGKLLTIKLTLRTADAATTRSARYRIR